MLTVENLNLHYGASQILHGVSLGARQGSVTAVMGTNGVGKTNLMRAIAGRHPYSGGRITLDGRDLDHPGAVEAVRAGIAHVPQPMSRDAFGVVCVSVTRGSEATPSSSRSKMVRAH